MKQNLYSKNRYENNILNLSLLVESQDKIYLSQVKRFIILHSYTLAKVQFTTQSHL